MSRTIHIRAGKGGDLTNLVRAMAGEAPTPKSPATVITRMTHAVSVLHHAADKGVAERRYADSLNEAKGAVADLIGKMTQIERLAREADPKAVDVPAMLGDIARSALAHVGGAA